MHPGCPREIVPRGQEVVVRPKAGGWICGLLAVVLSNFFEGVQGQGYRVFGFGVWDFRVWLCACGLMLKVRVLG